MIASGVPTTFAYQTTRADAIRSGINLTLRKIGEHAWFALWLGPAAYRIFHGHGQISSAGYLGSIFAVIAIIAAIHFAAFARGIGARFPNGSSVEPGDVSMGPLGITITWGFDSLFLAWPAIKDVSRQSGDVYLQTKTNQRAVVPRSAFPGPEAAEQFRASVKAGQVHGADIMAAMGGSDVWPPAPTGSR